MRTVSLLCHRCDTIEENVVVASGADYPHCPDCRSPRVWSPFGHLVRTDVYGAPRYSDATGMEHSSEREKEKTMAEWGYHRKGDKVGGARLDCSLKRSAFSYGGQDARTSTGERS